MGKVIAIAAGMLNPKKGDLPFRRAHKYLNFGLLSLASQFPVDVPVLHGHFLSPENFIEQNRYVLDFEKVLLSIPSFYSLRWAIEFANILAQYRAISEIHVGGRWVVDQNQDFLKSAFQQNVQFHSGLGESFVDAMCTKWGIGTTKVRPDNLELNYNLLPDRACFQPSIEVSRGCGLGCSFCAEAHVSLSKLKQPSRLFEEIESTLAIYREERNFYFESSMFGPNNSWVQNFHATYLAKEYSFGWRTETRVDVLAPEKVRLLSKSGLRVIDLGLESASPIQLMKMGKTGDPEGYLKKASLLLEACFIYGVKAKVNVLLYPGETFDTLDDTRKFLDQHRSLIYGVSVYPVVAYGMGQSIDTMNEFYKSHGSLGLSKTNIDGVWDVALSSELDSEKSKSISNEISREFMPRKHYYELKRFSYFDPSYSWEFFLRDADSLSAQQRPFGD